VDRLSTSVVKISWTALWRKVDALKSDAVTHNKPLCMPMGIYDRDTVLWDATDGQVLPVATYIVQVILGEDDVPYLCGISLHGL
jgi:hypothetical protein